jgi:hypothetical protein
MTAVFCKSQADFLNLRARPAKNFIRVRNEFDVRGRNITAVIFIHDWHNDNNSKKIIEAYDHLKKINPELFN